jgi:hypothetical protein
MQHRVQNLFPIIAGLFRYDDIASFNTACP